MSGKACASHRSSRCLVHRRFSRCGAYHLLMRNDINKPPKLITYSPMLVRHIRLQEPLSSIIYEKIRKMKGVRYMLSKLFSSVRVSLHKLSSFFITRIFEFLLYPFSASFLFTYHPN
ncbi:MAG: hypothetical protein LZF86_50151 [Nitrospira sp.]|nr:MAG: hypothetical protein LZF86_50151 [Nitrospira sp.]